MRQFALFCVSGVIGFLVDGGIVQLLVGAFGLDPYASRVVSFLCAMTATWLFNRHLTFTSAADEGRLRQWSRYLLGTLLGFAVNYAVYAAMVYHWPLVREWPVIGVAAGAVFGMVVNWLSARYWVFRHAPP